MHEYILRFQKAHKEATSQNAKDWLLIKAVFCVGIIGLIRATFSLVAYPPILLAIAI